MTNKNNITRKDAANLLEETIKLKKELDEQWDALSNVIGCAIESPLGKAVWRPIEHILELLSELLDDEIGSIGWFFWDNQCGEEGFEHSLPNGEMLEVRTVSDLLDVLGFQLEEIRND